MASKFLSHKDSSWVDTGISCPRCNNRIARETYSDGFPTERFACERIGCTWPDYAENVNQLKKLDKVRHELICMGVDQDRAKSLSSFCREKNVSIVYAISLEYERLKRTMIPAEDSLIPPAWMHILNTESSLGWWDLTNHSDKELVRLRLLKDPDNYSPEDTIIELTYEQFKDLRELMRRM